MYLDLSQSAKHGAQRMQHEYTPWDPYPWTGQLPEVLQCYAQEHPAYSKHNNKLQLQSTISTPTHFQKWPIFFFNAEKQTVSCGNTAKEVSFEWSHHGILSTDSKFRTIYKTNSTTSATKEVSSKWSHHRISSARSKVRTSSPNPSCSLAVKVLPWA